MEDVLERPRPRARGRFPVLNVALFLATIATTIWAGFLFSPLASEEHISLASVLEGGLPFAASLVGILFVHEMGHYVLARRHGVDSTLPFFIPAPVGFGTFGAVIRIRSALPSRRAVLDIGAAGPLAGFAVALPLLFVGLAQSEVIAAEEVAAAASPQLGAPFWLLTAFVEELARTGSLGEAASAVGAAFAAPGGELATFGDSLITRGAAWLVFGDMPAGHDVLVHPVALAAWLGLLVTTLNLVPLGQLDGGHVLYALLGRRGAERGSRLVSGFLLVMGLFAAWSWLVWWAITRWVVGVRHPPALSEEPLGPGRRAIAIFSLLLFALTFVPVPLR
ncbi:MAG TPA: site-2 protease family protein [Anaeromyxobacteraceae bacterium]|nr:site-2 protease family protein [Anaeromyxobacteraceae bacterium]